MRSWLRNLSLVVLTAVVVASFSALYVMRISGQTPTSAVPRTADGKPDFSESGRPTTQQTGIF
jgi:hypothetical protein